MEQRRDMTMLLPQIRSTEPQFDLEGDIEFNYFPQLVPMSFHIILTLACF